MWNPAAENGAGQEQTSTAAEIGTPAASQQGSGNAASALEAFLDSAAQPTSRYSQSYSRYISTLTQGPVHLPVCLT